MVEHDWKPRELDDSQKDYMRKMKVVGKNLQRRHDYCDENEHKTRKGKNMIREDGRCAHCFRNERYETPQTDRVLEQRKYLPSCQQPLDASNIMNLRSRERVPQMIKDNFRGVRELMGILFD